MQFLNNKEYLNSFQPGRCILNLIYAFQLLSLLFQGRLIAKMAQLTMPL